MNKIIAAVFMNLVFVLSLTIPTSADTGGPDSYGYTWDDAETYTWEDISDGSLGPSGDDILGEAVEPGFAFVFYGRIYTKLRIATNGHISFGNETSWDVGCDEGAIELKNYAGLWTDINASSTGAIYHKSVGEEGDRRFIVQYDGVPILDNDQDLATFQIVLEEGSNDLIVRIQDPFESTSKKSNLSIKGFQDGEYLSADCAAPVNAPEKAWRFIHPDAIGEIIAQPRFSARIVNSENPQAVYFVDIYNGGSESLDYNAQVSGSDWVVILDTDSDSIPSGELRTLQLSIEAPADRRQNGSRDLASLQVSGDLDLDFPFTTVFQEDFSGLNIDVGDLNAQPVVDGLPEEGEYNLAEAFRVDNNQNVLAHFYYFNGVLYWLVEDFTYKAGDAGQLGFYFDPEGDAWDADESDGNYWFINENGENRVLFRSITEIWDHPQYGDPITVGGLQYASSPYRDYAIHEIAMDVDNFFFAEPGKGTLPCWFYFENQTSGFLADWLGLSESGGHLDPFQYGTLTHDSFEIPVDDDADDDINDDIDDDSDDDLNDDVNDDLDEDLDDGDEIDDDAPESDDDDNDEGGCGCL